MNHFSFDSSDVEWVARACGKAKWLGSHQWVCQCPAHKDKTPSLSVSLGNKGQILFYCHAGCPYDSIMDAASSEVQNLVKAKRGETRYRHIDIYKQNNLKTSNSSSDISITDNLDKTDNSEVNPQLLALKKVIKDAKPVIGSPVEAYLNQRLDGRFSAVQDMVAASGFIQCLPSHWHAESRQSWPVMVALILKEGKLIGLHRTYLDGNGNKAPVFPTKKIVGKLAGGYTPFGTVQNALVITEGIETALSLYAMFQTPVWAALSATNLANVALPPLPLAQVIYIAQDNDAAGRKGARKAADKFFREGRRVVFMEPPDALNDFNDYLAAGEPFEQYRHRFH